MLLRLCEGLDLEALAMTRPTVGGPLNYAALAQLHRPADPNRLATEIRRLHRDGLTAQDIATALRIDVVQVATVLHVMSDQQP
jgi:hypothetical protein